MNTWLKFALACVGAVAVLFVILVVAVTLIIEPNDYRPYIVDAVEDATGRNFEVPGDLGLSLFPCCSVSVGASRLGNPPDFVDDDFASFESASLSLKLWPLLTRREVRIGTVTLDGLDVNLTRLEDGRVNWEFEDVADADPEPEPGQSDAALADLSVEGLALRNGRIRYRDLAAGQDYTAENVRLDTGIAMADERLTMNGTAFGAVVRGSDVPGGTADISVSADAVAALLGDDVQLTVDGLRADVQALESRLQITGGGTAGEALAMTGEFTLEQTSPRELLAALSEALYEPADDDALTRLTASGAWTLGTSFIKIDGIDVQLDDSRLTGSVSVDDFDTAAARFDLVLDRLDVDGYSPAAAASEAGSAPTEPTVIPLASLADVNVNGKLRIDTLRAAGVEMSGIEFALASQAGTVTANLSGRAANGSFALDGRGAVSGTDPQLSGNLTVDGVSPRALLQGLDADTATADPDVLRIFSGNSRWRLTPRTLALEDMRWRLDDTTATGSFAVADFDTLASRFDVTLDRLNVDAYLAPDDDEAAEGEVQTEIPVEAIRALRLNGRLRAGEITLLDLSLRNVVATVSADDGVLRLDPLTAALYGGEYRGTVVIDATGSTAILNVEQELAAVQVGDMLQSFFGSDLLAGSLSMQLRGRGAGNNAADLLRGLAGNVSFDLTDGAYRGKDLLYEVQRARALFNKEPAPQAPADPTTPIRALNMSGTVADGILQTNEFVAETTGLRLLGDGGINLVELALDYKLDARVLQAAASAARLGDLTNATIPLTIRGPLNSPSVAVDFRGLVTGAVRDTVQQKARERLLDRLGGSRGEAAQGPAAEGPADETADGTPTDESATATKPDREPSPRDLLRQGLRGLLESREKDESAADETAEDESN